MASAHLIYSILYNHQWMLAAKLAGKKCLTHERGINPRYTIASRYFAKRLDAIICISESVRCNMVRRGIDLPGMVTILNGLDASEMRVNESPETVRIAYGIRLESPVIGVVGNIKEWKGQETLIRATALLVHKFPRIQALIVGATSPDDYYYEKRLRALVTELEITQNVIFTGFRKNVADVINVMDIVVHTSILPEPFGRVLLESMALRKPVIGSRDGGVLEIIDEGTSGYTFPPGDAEALASKVSDLLSDREKMKKMGENGYEILNKKFHISRNVELTQQLYEKILGT